VIPSRCRQPLAVSALRVQIRGEIALLFGRVAGQLAPGDPAVAFVCAARDAAGTSLPTLLLRMLAPLRRSRRPLYHVALALGNLGEAAVSACDRWVVVASTAHCRLPLHACDRAFRLLLSLAGLSLCLRSGLCWRRSQQARWCHGTVFASCPPCWWCILASTTRHDASVRSCRWCLCAVRGRNSSRGSALQVERAQSRRRGAWTVKPCRRCKASSILHGRVPCTERMRLWRGA
jgi:hypothetical protein